jgi:IS30 family transposase
MSHLTSAQRYTIGVMKKEGYSQKDISTTIGKHKSVISRELRRNCDLRTGEYRSDLAQRKYDTRQKNKAKQRLFTEGIKKYVKTELENKLSPEQIVGKAKKLGKSCVSHERIYQYIWADKKKGGSLYEHLRTQGKKYRKRGNSKDKRGKIVGRVDINHRPAIVEKRERFGDFEIDTIIGKNHKGAIVTINDRATGLLKMKKLESKNAEILADKTIKILSPYKELLHTITSDNGKEFAAHKRIAEQLNIQFYFAHPYHSWERGSNENLNGLIRQYIPKKSNFDDFSDEYIQWVEDELNNRPRKRFEFFSPNEIINQKVAFVT